MTEAYDHLYKLVLIGDSAVGKSNILSRFTANKFSASSVATIGVEFTTKALSVDVNGRMVATRLQCWDTAGQERYRSITSSYYRGAHGCLLVYDVTKRASFEHCRDWLRELRATATMQTRVILVGNKIDLRHLREVPPEEAAAYAAQEQIAYVETSASSGQGVEDAFRRLVTDLVAAESLALAAGGGRVLQQGPAPILTADLNSQSVKKPKKRC
ncbi:Rab11 [Giardia muris]|uniref:Rab11 n=1 Tax=Giardia muris TaxID=5742 RepID=A0A4Z1SXZ4_GIAMU|nr:Rab11 [Giardia muris]|eukprot:TNJ26553.1 Rab11 [Giardia muris]